jgi:peptide/nickel transport system permease protein
MQRYILIRLVQAIFAIWAVTVIVFALSHASGDPLTLLVPLEATHEEIAEIRRFYGLDKPIHVQYWKFLSHAVQGDFGRSTVRPDYEAMELVLSRVPATLQLGAAAILLAAILGVPLGVFSAVRRDTPLDYVGKIFALLGQSVPPFWIGLMLMWVLSVELGWLPTSGKGGIDHMIMPVIAVGWFQVAAIMRLVRSAMLDNLDSEYIKLARIKGISEWKVIWKHCLRNAVIPALTYFGVTAGLLVTGGVIVETVFAWPGVGLLAVEAATNRDFQVLQAVVVLGAVLFVLLNLAVDILYGYLDPRIRLAS